MSDYSGTWIFCCTGLIFWYCGGLFPGVKLQWATVKCHPTGENRNGLLRASRSIIGQILPVYISLRFSEPKISIKIWIQTHESLPTVKTFYMWNPEKSLFCMVRISLASALRSLCAPNPFRVLCPLPPHSEPPSAQLRSWGRVAEPGSQQGQQIPKAAELQGKKGHVLFSLSDKFLSLGICLFIPSLVLYLGDFHYILPDMPRSSW